MKIVLGDLMMLCWFLLVCGGIIMIITCLIDHINSEKNNKIVDKKYRGIWANESSSHIFILTKRMFRICGNFVPSYTAVCAYTEGNDLYIELGNQISQKFGIFENDTTFKGVFTGYTYTKR